MKVPVLILPPERSESVEPSLHSSLSPSLLTKKVQKSSIRDIGLGSASYGKAKTQRLPKSPEEELLEQSARAKELADQLEKTKKDLDKQQEEIDAVNSAEQDVVQEAEKELEQSPEKIPIQSKEELKKIQMSIPDTENTINQIKQLLKEKHPSLEKLMDISLKQEREKHERQNEKVLQILRVKDNIIAELQQKLDDSESQLKIEADSRENFEKELKTLKKQYEATLKNEQNLKQNLAEHEETIKLLNDNREQLKETLKSGAGSIEGVDKENIELQQKVADLTEELEKYKSENEKLIKELSTQQKKVVELTKREDFVLELANRQEEIKKNHQEELNKKIIELEEITKELENTKKTLDSLKTNESKLKSDLEKLKDVEKDLLKARDEKSELEGRIAELEEIYRNDNEKLANLIQNAHEPQKPEKSFTIDDLRSSSKDYIVKLKEKIESLQQKVNELEAEKQAIDAKNKLTESMIQTQQADKNSLITKYTEEIKNLQASLLASQRKNEKITKDVFQQTALKGDDVNGLSKMIEDYKEKLEFSSQQREEREKYISQLEQELENQKQETNRAKTDFDVVMKKLENNTGSLEKLEENEVVTKLNARVSAQQIEIHQLTKKLQDAENMLNKAQNMQPLAEKTSKVEDSSRNNKQQTQITEHVTERMEALELTIVQLREEIIQLEVEKRNLEQNCKYELEMRDAKLKAYENNGSDTSKSQTMSNARLENQTLKEINKTLESKIKQIEQENANLQKELIRYKQTEKLSAILPNDSEIMLKLTTKLKEQKSETRHLQGLLRRAKIEFDKMTSAIQERRDSKPSVVTENKMKESVSSVGSIFEYDRFANSRYEAQIQELLKRCQEFRGKLNDSLRVTLELKEEFTHKLMEQEERHQKQLFKFAEDLRQKSREVETLSLKLEKATERTNLETARADEISENSNKRENDLMARISQLEENLSNEKNNSEHSKDQIKKNELMVKERSAQIQILMETVEVLQKNTKETIAQRYLNSNAELCSVKSMNAKLETRIIDLERMLNDQKKLVEKSIKNENKFSEEKSALLREISANKKTIDLQIKEIDRLEKEIDELSIKSANEESKVKTMEEQAKISYKRIEMLKNQLSEIQIKEKEQQIASQRSTAKPLKSPITSLNTSMSKWPAQNIEESNMGIKGSDNKQIAILIKQLITELDSKLQGDEKNYNAIFKQICGIITKSDQIISELEKNNFELEQKVLNSQIKMDEKQNYENLLMKYNGLQYENTELHSIMENMIAGNEKSLLENNMKLQQNINDCKKSLYLTNCKMLELSAENEAFKASNREAQDKLDAKIKENQLTKSKLEKEITLARIKAEEEMSLKLTIRNEEIKTYFDSHVSKLILGKEEGSQLLTLSREVCAQKLLVEKLQFAAENLTKEKTALEQQIVEIMSAFDREAEQLAQLHAETYVRHKKKYELYGEMLKEIREKGKFETEPNWSKKGLKVLLDQKLNELSEINAAFTKLKDENSKLKIQIEQRNTYEKIHGVPGSAIEELESKLSTLNSLLNEKTETIEMMEKKISDLMNEHMLELQNMQSDAELHIQEERKKIMDEYELLAKKYKPGEAPGEISAENQELKNQCIALKSHIENLEAESVIIRQKLDSVTEECNSYKNEAELYKKALLDVQENITGNINLPQQMDYTPYASTSSRVKGNIGTPADKKVRESKKKIIIPSVGDKPKVEVKDEENLPKMPKLIKSLLVTKYEEAAAESKVRKLAQNELESRKTISKLQSQLNEQDAKLRHYERLLKDNNIKITENTIEDEDQNLIWMKKRILELEAACEDLRIKELSQLANYATFSNEESKNQLETIDNDPTIMNLLINGIIVLCNKLANLEISIKERGIPSEDNSNSVERLQRIIIKALSSLLKKFQGDPAWNVQCAVPSNENDKLVWYLELVEMQAQHVEKSIQQLKEYTSRISVEITGSLASAAQVKAAALELANQTKEVAEETNALKQACGLVKKDLEIMLPGQENISRASKIQSTSQAPLKPISELNEKLQNAENAKKNLENELIQLKLALSYNQTEGKTVMETSKTELEKAMKRNRELELDLISSQNKCQELEKDLLLEKTTSDELRRDLSQNAKKLTEINNLLEKCKKELADSMKSSDMLMDKENKLKQFEINFSELRQKNDELLIENKELKAKILSLNKKLESAGTESETIKALQRENRDLEAKLHSEIIERKAEIEFWIKERAQMRQLIDSMKIENTNVLGTKKDSKGTVSDSEYSKSGTASVKSKDQNIKKPGHSSKYKEKAKKLEKELAEKSVELFKIQSELQDVKSKLHMSELQIEDERRKVITVTADLKELQAKSRASATLSAEAEFKKENDDLRNNLDTMKALRERLENDVYEKTKKINDLLQERDKLAIVIDEMDHEIREKTKLFDNDKASLEVELEKSNQKLRAREQELEKISEKLMRTEQNYDKIIEELNKTKNDVKYTNEDKEKLQKNCKEMETVVLTQEEVVNKLKQDLISREEEYKNSLSELQKEYKEAKLSNEDLLTVYEMQLKLLKERFKDEYVELQNKLTVHTQAKGILSPKRKEQSELSVDLMFQLSQKEAVIKNLEKELSKFKTKVGNQKTKIAKLQGIVKDEAAKEKPKPKGKTFIPADIQRKSKEKTSLKQPQKDENSSLILNTVNTEDQMKAYNDLLKEKTDFEMKYGKVQGSLKGLELKLNMERERADVNMSKLEECKLEIENLKEALKSAKKEQSELIKKHKSELQKVLDEMIQVKSTFKTPEELLKCQEEKKELENQVKVLKDELNRKKDLIKQFKEKDELRQSENGQFMSEIESVKDENEKLKKMMKELSRKEQTLKTLKISADNSKEAEKQLSEENKALVEKLKAAKAEISRKDTLLKTLKEKTEETKTEKDLTKEKENEIEKLKAKIASAKQDLDRKDDQIKSLKAKIESLMQDYEKTKSELEIKSKTSMPAEKPKKKNAGITKQKLQAAESKNQQLSILLRTLFRELLTEIEKLRMRVGAYKKGLAKAKAENESKFYKESLDILGLGAEDMGEFMSEKDNFEENNQDLIELVTKINRIVENNEISQDYEDIIAKYKELMKEKVDLERSLSNFEEKTGEKPTKKETVSLQEEKVSSQENNDKKLKTIGEILHEDS